MKRSIHAGLALSTLVLGIILPAAPALAKEPGWGPPAASALISGPGGHPSIVIRGGSAFRMLYLTTFRGYGVGEPAPPSRDRLGPSLEVRYFVALNGGPVRTITQDLYPFAQDGAVWAFTPAGQPTISWRMKLPASDGWWHSVALRAKLAGWGLAAASHGTAATVAAKGRGSLVWVWFWIGVLLAAVALTRSAIARRRRPTSAPSPTLR